MTVSPSTLGMNLWILLGALLALGIVVFLVVAFWTSIKIWIWRVVQRRSQAAYHAQRYHADGRPRPHAAPGVCTACGRLNSRVYHLPDGRRLCPDHYEAEERA